MTTYSDIVKDESTGQPISGVNVWVYNLDKTLATITPTNPVITDSYGEFSFDAADNLYRVSYVVGGKTVEKDYIIVGNGPSIPQDVLAALIPFLSQITDAEVAAAGSVTAAASYATTAQAFGNGYLFADTGAGISGTTNGKYFVVPDTGNDVLKLYKNNSGTAAFQMDLPSNATLLALVASFAQSDASADLLDIADSAGNVGFAFTDDGRILDASGRDIIGELRAAAYATAPVAVAAATTGAMKFSTDTQTALAGDPVMFDVLLWGATDSGSTNAMRMPGGDFLIGDTMHLFAMGKHGDSTTNMSGENGFRGVWRTVAWDFDNHVAPVGSINVLKQPSAWAGNFGTEGTFSVHKITQGTHAGTIEVLWGSVQPDNVAFDTPGTKTHVYYATSADSYATQTKLIDGADPYSHYSISAPSFLIGPAPLPQAIVEIPSGQANAGRRVAVLTLPTSSGTSQPFTIYAENNALFTDAFSYGTTIPVSGSAPTSVTETSLAYNGGTVHSYTRIDDADGSNNLTHRGLVHNTSPTGIGGWSAREYLSSVPFTNVQPAALGIQDGAGRIIVGASTALVSGLRNEFVYGITYDGSNFVATVSPAGRSAVRGYGKLIAHTDTKGRFWVVHIYEEADGTDGFNFVSHIRGRAMNLPWIMRNAVAI